MIPVIHGILAGLNSGSGGEETPAELPDVAWIADFNPALATVDGSNKISACGPFLQGTSAWQPTLIANAQNGKPAARFTLHQMKTPSTNTTGLVYFVAWKALGAATGDYHTLVMQDGGAYNQFYVADHEQIFNGDLGGFDSGLSTIAANVPMITISKNAGTSVTFRRNGLNGNTINVGGFTSSTAPFSIGSFGALNGAANGDFYRVLIGPGSMTTQQITDTENYLKSTYGIPY